MGLNAGQTYGNRRPQELAVICPRCKKEARFITGMIGCILKREIPLFSTYRNVDCHASPGDYYAVYYPELYEVPAELSAELSRFKYHPYGSQCEYGSLICKHCLLRKKHQLNWVNDAFFQWSTGHGKTLRAWNREHAMQLKEYICSKKRVRSCMSFSLPAEFKKKQMREFLCKKMTKTLL